MAVNRPAFMCQPSLRFNAMKKLKLFTLTFTVAVNLLVTVPVLAQNNLTTAVQSDALFKTFGEKAGLVRLMDDFMVRLVADARTGPFFKDSNLKLVKSQLVDQFCVLIGGGCPYKGDTMKEVHGGMKIKKSDFNALVELLQLSMDAQSIPFTAQNQLLAKLAPMHRDTITVH